MFPLEKDMTRQLRKETESLRFALGGVRLTDLNSSPISHALNKEEQVRCGQLEGAFQEWKAKHEQRIMELEVREFPNNSATLPLNKMEKAELNLLRAEIQRYTYYLMDKVFIKPEYTALNTFPCVYRTQDGQTVWSDFAQLKLRQLKKEELSSFGSAKLEVGEKIMQGVPVPNFPEEFGDAIKLVALSKLGVEMPQEVQQDISFLNDNWNKLKQDEVEKSIKELQGKIDSLGVKRKYEIMPQYLYQYDTLEKEVK